ncbi:hypothetical protein Ahy_B01g057024 isoform E [Arachis hypogaea]|uniref:Uncharacterized protein n=1 Tax=Arachis hypogaea TaxID=3818 RepID=A0A445B043_ARAHY|nr:hypothetical protein Ahy_B01g057024 isoform E [Arachis hypogaea]
MHIKLNKRHNHLAYQKGGGSAESKCFVATEVSIREEGTNQGCKVGAAVEDVDHVCGCDVLQWLTYDEGHGLPASVVNLRIIIIMFMLLLCLCDIFLIILHCWFLVCVTLSLSFHHCCSCVEAYVLWLLIF